MRDKQLLPCPFCGNPPRFLEHRAGYYDEAVICDTCGFAIRGHCESVKRWNMRTLAAQQDDASADGTPDAHPAYWRGEARGVEGACMRISAALDGEDSGAGVLGNATLEALRRRLLTARAQGVPEGWRDGAQKACNRIKRLALECPLGSSIRDDANEWAGELDAMLAAAPAPDPVPVAVPDAAQAKRDAAHSRLVAYGRELIASDARGEAADWRREYAELMARKPDDVELPDAAQAKGEAVAWIRLCSDGSYEGPLHDSQMDDIRRRSGAWTPLGVIASPAQHAPTGAQVVTDEMVERAATAFIAENKSEKFVLRKSMYAALTAAQTPTKEPRHD